MSHLYDFPQLQKVVEGNEKIVYLCGAGISMSLGNHSLGWKNWMDEGVKYLAPEDVTEYKEIVKVGSADALVNAATFLLELLKNNGCYEKFMDETIGSLRVSDLMLAKFFRDVFRTRDIVATTNYDHLIEDAADVEGISYSDPGKALQYVTGKNGNKVLHLHGIYDRRRGVDDIIADSAQYDDIVKNEGAQFIQELIGTHPIIMIGCGGTVDDQNLSGFMSFIVEKLKTSDVPYFYVMKEGDAVPELPINAIPVYYGREYVDLPLFLHEIASLRLRKRIGIDRGIASVYPYSEMPKVKSAFGRMHFSNGFIPFIGRESEMEMLFSLTAGNEKFRWISVTGPGGIGKSRLVIEWLRELPVDWMGFFVNKNSKGFSDIEWFANTVFVFDYIIGDEENCARIIGELLDVFSFSPYQMRVIFVERDQEAKDKDDFWMNRIIKKLNPGHRLMFDAAGSLENAVVLDAMSEANESKYIEAYLKEYLPIVEDGDYVRYCENHLSEVVNSIGKGFAKDMSSEYHRPLFLSVYIEVWIMKSGEMSADTPEALLREYVLKERRRWLSVLGSEELVNAYLSVLSVACAIEHFNISDVKGDNYLEAECGALVNMFDQQYRTPGTENFFRELYVSRDELIDTIADDSIFLKIAAPKGTAERYDDTENLYDGNNDVGRDIGGFESSEVLPVLSEGILDVMAGDERVAYATPYIKLDADPQEMLYNLLENAGALDKEEKKELKKLRKKNKEYYEGLPDHAWTIEPLIPDIIREYIVLYCVNAGDAEKFAQLVRSNSVFEFQAFLARAMEDWPDSVLFETLLVTPPLEVFNYFEYYFGLLRNTREVKDFEPIENLLIKGEYTPLYYIRYEMELWKHIAIVLTERDDVDDLSRSSTQFFHYVSEVCDHPLARDLLPDVLEAYSAGIHNSGRIEYFERFLAAEERIINEDTNSEELNSAMIGDYGRLIHLRRYHKETRDTMKDWANIDGHIRKCQSFNEDVLDKICEAAKECRIVIGSQKKSDAYHLVVAPLEYVHSKTKSKKIAGELSICYANIATGLRNKHESVLASIFDKVKNLHREYPDDKKIRMSYIRCIESELENDGYRDVPKKTLQMAREWYLQYPDEIEFKEAYFGLLLTHLFYSQRNDMRNEQRRTFKIMKEVAESADYDEYNEENQMMQSIRNLEFFYGY